ncbi:MAG: Transcriptional regulator, TrmB [uncultured bacterium]|nr:MAG: Transcriptional regulator, TrmB [uncultured bacterium]
MQNIKEILTSINVPSPAQDIYMALLENGKATARTLSHRTGITRTSVYDHIKILRTKGLVVERSIEGTTIFEIGDARQLSILLNEQAEQLYAQQDFLKKNLNNLIDKSQSLQPKIRFFEGKEGVRQLLKDILWHDDVTLYLYWPYEHMLDFMGEDFLLWFRDRRKFHNIPILTIWAHPSGKVKKHIFADDDKDVERRYLIQKDISSMGYIIYDNKVAFMSSRKESFGFIVESVEFVSLQKMQFDVLWNIARKK